MNKLCSVPDFPNTTTLWKHKVCVVPKQYVTSAATDPDPSGACCFLARCCARSCCVAAAAKGGALAPKPGSLPSVYWTDYLVLEHTISTSRGSVTIDTTLDFFPSPPCIDKQITKPIGKIIYKFTLEFTWTSAVTSKINKAFPKMGPRYVLTYCRCFLTYSSKGFSNAVSWWALSTLSRCKYSLQTEDEIPSFFSFCNLFSPLPT